VVPQTTIYFRAFVYASQNNSRSDFAFMIGRNPGYELFNLAAEKNGGAVYYSDGIGGGRTDVSTTNMPYERWVCVEWQIISATSDMGGGSRVWLDGTEIPELKFLSGYPTTPFPSWLILGLEPQQNTNTGPLDVWFDEVAVDSQPIGCAK
jgi:hypothetical protein